MKKSLFITSILPADLRFQLLAHGFQITEKSMIKTEPFSFDSVIPKCEWIFFSSKNAVHFFFEGKPVLKHQKFAAIGKGTEQEVKKYAACDFVGDTNNIGWIGQQFADKIGSAMVLFPQSNSSLRSIQSQLNPAQVIDMICYTCSADPSLISPHDICIFTSPSNTQAYLEKNEITARQKIIAYGQSTAKALNSRGVQEVIIPDSLETKALLDTILHTYHS